MLMNVRIIPTIFDLSSWTHLIFFFFFDPFDFNMVVLCPWAMPLFQKLCPALFLPVSHSFPEPHPGPQCCLYNLLEGQPENSWSLGKKYCVIFNLSRYSGLHLPCFLQHVQQQHLSLNPLGWVTGTPVKSPSVGIPSRTTGFPGIMFTTLGDSPAGRLGPNPYHASPKG